MTISIKGGSVHVGIICVKKVIFASPHFVDFVVTSAAWFSHVKFFQGGREFSKKIFLIIFALFWDYEEQLLKKLVEMDTLMCLTKILTAFCLEKFLSLKKIFFRKKIFF